LLTGETGETKLVFLGGINTFLGRELFGGSVLTLLTLLPLEVYGNCGLENEVFALSIGPNEVFIWVEYLILLFPCGELWVLDRFSVL